MTRLPIVPRIMRCGFIIGMMSLCWFSPVHGQTQNPIHSVSEKAFRELVTKYKEWKVDSIWGYVSMEDQKEYKFSPLATISFTSKKFDAVDNNGKHTEGKWIKNTVYNGKDFPTVSFNTKRTIYLVLSGSSIGGPKPFLVLDQPLEGESNAWYRLRPK